jgi:hypothetical protein
MRIRRLLAGVVAGGTLFGTLVLTTTAASASPISLALPQGYAFAILGHSCGGIQEKVYATGFDPTSGYPVGAVYMSTRCGGSGRVGGGVSTLYSAWASVTWDFTSVVVSYAKVSPAPTVDPGLVNYDSHGNELYNQATAGVVGGTQVTAQAYLVLASGFVPLPRLTGTSATEGPAAGGTSLTITGTGFTSATAVNFAGVPDTSITVTGDTSITLVTPPTAPGTDAVTVTNSGGTSADSATFQFTFVPAPVISSLSPDNGPVGGGNSITITGSGFTFASGVTFGDQGAGFTIDNDTSITAFVPASDCACQSDSSSVTVSSVGGVSNSATYNYTNVAPGTPDAPVIGTAAAGHGSSSVAFTPPANDGGSPITSYTAIALDTTNAANGGQSASGGSSPITVTGLTNGDSYTFTVTATNANGTGPASASSNAIVPISSAPLPLVISTSSPLPDAALGSLYSTQLYSAGGGATCRWRKIGALPRGLRLTGSGILTGIPNARVLSPGMYAITVEVISRTRGYPVQIATAVLTLTIT